MRTIQRALRALARSPLRSGAMLTLLAVCTALALLMLTVDGAFADRLDEIRSDVGTEVTIRPAGSFPGAILFGGADAPTLSAEDIARLDGLSNVTGARATLVASYTGDALQPAEPTPREGAGDAVAAKPVVIQAGNGTQTFSIPISILGTDTPDNLRTADDLAVTVADGRTFTANEMDANVAVIGRGLAEENGLALGSTFDLNGTSVEVIGIFDSEQFFGDNSILMPLTSVQRLFEKPGEVSTLVLTVSSIEQVESVADEARQRLGEEVADVTSSMDEYERIGQPLSDARASSRIGLIAALGASGVVILLSVALAARSRLKEIGILKAIGAGTRHVALQFGVESLAISLVAALAGAALTFPFAQQVANGLIPDPEFPGVVSFSGDGTFEASNVKPVTSGRLGGLGGDLLGDVAVAVDPQVFAYALLLAIGLALLASVVPAWQVARIKPAEVLRYE